jgi:hypothetical protein
MKNFPQLPDIPEEQQTPLVKVLLGLLEQQSTRIVLLEETVAGLKDEINILKGEKKRPTFKPSGMEKPTDKKSGGAGNENKRAGSKKKSKNAQLAIHEDVTIRPSTPIPPGSRFKGYRNFVVQDLTIACGRGANSNLSGYGQLIQSPAMVLPAIVMQWNDVTVPRPDCIGRGWRPRQTRDNFTFGEKSPRCRQSVAEGIRSADVSSVNDPIHSRGRHGGMLNYYYREAV